MVYKKSSLNKFIGMHNVYVEEFCVYIVKLSSSEPQMG